MVEFQFPQKEFDLLRIMLLPNVLVQLHEESMISHQ